MNSSGYVSLKFELNRARLGVTILVAHCIISHARFQYV